MSSGWFVNLRTIFFHKYKVHVRADTWDGGKCLCGLGQGGRSGGFRNPFSPLTPSGAEGELVLLNGLFDPGP